MLTSKQLWNNTHKTDILIPMSIPRIKQDLWEYLSEVRRPIALYGTGDGADKIIAVLEQYGLKDLIASVFASDGFVRDRMFRGFKVMSYDECCKALFHEDFIVLVCFGSSRPEVLSQIEKIATERELYVPDVPVYGNVLFNRSFYESNAESEEYVLSRLSDDISRSCYTNYINYKLSGSLSYLEKCESDPKEEFELLKGMSGSVYVDLGAYYGDTLNLYLDKFPQLRKAVAIEPERHSFSKLNKCAEDLRNAGYDITCINALAGSKTGTELVSDSRGRGTRSVSNSNVVINKTKEISVVTVDSLMLSGVGFIKFDVEGSELEAVEGAKETILRDRPVLKIACYHRSEDVFEIVKKVLGIRPDYKVYMRHTRCIPGWDTDFYFM
ncbi:MAG: FkbM family methyltransferase [Clostridiales bacterium]|nr:FkbM family methyltransferase [Clostridiales bacterium]